MIKTLLFRLPDFFGRKHILLGVVMSLLLARGQLSWAGDVSTSVVGRYDSYRGLIMAGYQGWFNAPGEGPYQRIAGPGRVNSTGTQIQKIGQKRYALFGSADRTVYIYTYPDLKPAGELRMHRPPWNDRTGTRIWPNVIPLPEGYPARYIALMMDRLNFPGMKGANWTYGAMYLYHAHPADGDQQDYE